MIERLLHRYQQRIQQRSATAQRSSLGLLSGSIGLAINALVFLLKLMIGLATGSVAIIADAFNNLSDALSSVVTVVGFKMAAKSPDNEHPYGHQRAEAIAGLFIGISIFLVGVEFSYTSFQKIMHPAPIQVTWLALVILVATLGLKAWQGRFYQQVARYLNSDTLVASAKDSYNDVYTTLVVLLALVLQTATHWQLDGWFGLLIALYILASSVHLIRGFINTLLGYRPSQSEIEAITNQLDHYATILGYHDLLIHEYGPHAIYVTVHIEMDSSLTLDQAHQVIDKIEDDFERDFHIHVLCHVDPIDITNHRYARYYEIVQELVADLDQRLRTHDFHVDPAGQNRELIQFDVVVPDDVTLSDELIRKVVTQRLHDRIGVTVDTEIHFDHHYFAKDHSLI